jgi:hypothetical protein
MHLDAIECRYAVGTQQIQIRYQADEQYHLGKAYLFGNMERCRSSQRTRVIL